MLVIHILDLTILTSYSLELKSIFLGYSTISKGYLCLNLSTKHVYTSTHVLFNEFKFPYSLLAPVKPTSSNMSPFSSSNAFWLSNLLYLHSTNQPTILGSSPSTQSNYPSPPVVRPTIIPTTTPDTSSPTTPITTISYFAAPIVVASNSTTPIATSAAPTTAVSNFEAPIPVSLPHSHTSTQNQHPIRTRSKNSITKPKLCYKVIVDYTYTEPPTYKITSQYAKWCEAMDVEFQALQRQETWTLVPSPPNVSLIGCK